VFKEKTMKHLSTLALVLTLGAAGIQARNIHVQMTFSGTQSQLVAQVSLAPGTGPTGEAMIAGDGSLGPFTDHEVGAGTAAPTSFGCAGPNSAAFATVVAAGIFRFQDGSLLTYKTTAGTQCIDFTKGTGTIVFTYGITGGTGIFKNATGTLQVRGSGYPTLFDATGHLIALGVITDGKITGTIVVPDGND
jgi:hypothetical protein